MKKQEIKKLKKTEIVDNINKFKKDLFNLRFQKINGQLNSYSKIKLTKKSIARLKTLLKGNLNA
ncbi:MAG: 50S ribosomal protein L29 [Candidatus Pelagibacter sp.]